MTQQKTKPPLTAEQTIAVRDQAESVFEERLKSLKRLVTAFLAGLMLFFGFGVVFKTHVLQPILRFVYPAEKIYEDIKPAFLADSELQRQLAQRDDLKQALFEAPNKNVNLETFPTIKGELPPEIWHTMKAGDKEAYLELLESSGFPDALKAKYYKDLVLTYEVHKPYNEELIVKEVLEKGKIPLRCRIEMVATSLEGGDTSFAVSFSHSKKQAIIVIPRQAHDNSYSWLQRPRSNFPWLYVKIETAERNADMVSVVGIERTGGSDSLVVRVSKAVATELGFRSDYSSMIGKFTVVDARFF